MSGLVTREHATIAAQNAMINQGYAVAVHGSRRKDLDLIAVPWTEETPFDPETVAEMIAAAIPGTVVGEGMAKPHGRVAFTIQIHPIYQYGFDRWYIDLSVMPRTEGPTL
jgi:hypothetical protein